MRAGMALLFLKVVREPLILTGGALGLHGATLKSAAAAGQAILSLVLVAVATGPLGLGVGAMTVINVALVAVWLGLAGLRRPPQPEARRAGRVTS